MNDTLLPLKCWQCGSNQAEIDDPVWIGRGLVVCFACAHDIVAAFIQAFNYR